MPATPSTAPAVAAPPSAPQTSTPLSSALPETTPTTSPYDEHASAVVRRYLDALIRGDEKTAYAALGASGGTLSEQAFLDPSARISSLKVTRIDASNASVECEIVSAKGHYYATYHVTAATGGPYISEHDYIKV
jgi:D-serine dehydratase